MITFTVGYMLFDHGFLATLQSDDLEGWAHELHSSLCAVKHEVVGALLVRRRRPFAVSVGRIGELRSSAASLGGLLGRGLWLGADQCVPFHTKITAGSPEISQDDITYAQRVRDLAHLMGSFHLAEHLVILPDGAASLGRELAAPCTLKQMEGWRSLTTTRLAARYRQPVTGEVSSGVGITRPWIRHALDLGFSLEDFEVPQLPNRLAPRGVPLGASDFLTVSLDLEPKPSRDAYIEEFPVRGKLEVPFHGAVIAPAFGSLAQSEESQVGILFSDEAGNLTTPRAGWIAPESFVTRHPGHLFATSYADEASWAATFSTRSLDTIGRREVLRRLLALGQLLGVPIKDHLILAPNRKWMSTRRDRRLARAWRAIPPVDQPLWPHSRQAHQTSLFFRHPTDNVEWSGRGRKPRWLRQLLESGWLLDELVDQR